MHQSIDRLHLTTNNTPPKQDVDLVFITYELLVIAKLGCAILVGGFFLMAVATDWGAAGLWLLQACLLWSYVCLCVRRRLALNRASTDAPCYRDLGWGNRLTILRGGLIALTGGFLFVGQSAVFNVWVPAILYTLAAILDRLDGFAARRSGQTSLLGNELDITFDALGLVVAPLLAIVLGKLQSSYLLLSVAYYLYQWGIKRRQRLGLPVYPLPPNPLRRTLAGFQMGFVAVALWPLLDASLTTIAGVAFMLPVLFGFAMDWWVVCGGLQLQTYGRLEVWSGQFFQPALRLLPALLLLLVVRDSVDPPEGMLIFTWLFGTGLMLFGVAGRIGALGLIVLLGWRPWLIAGDALNYLLIFSASWILLLGTGRYSLWQWGDDWIKRYDGA